MTMMTAEEFTLSDETRKRISDVAKARGLTATELLEQTVSRSLDEDEQVLEAVKKGRASKRSASHADVSSWLSSWGSDDEQERPTCE